MIPNLEPAQRLVAGILHVCGDDPLILSFRRFFLRVFSTYVDMILRLEAGLEVKLGILHVCGDDPVLKTDDVLSSRYSPRMWR